MPVCFFAIPAICQMQVDWVFTCGDIREAATSLYGFKLLLADVMSIYAAREQVPANSCCHFRAEVRDSAISAFFSYDAEKTYNCVMFSRWQDASNIFCKCTDKMSFGAMSDECL